jgi:regulatory protein
VEKTWDKLLKFASLRPRSEKEIKNWFLKKKVPASKEKIYLTRLKELEMIGDEQFAAWWIEQRNAFRPRSKRHLAWELAQKGINRELIQKVLAEVDELLIAQSLIAQRSFADQRELETFLAHRGFDWEVVKKVKLASGVRKK